MSLKKRISYQSRECMGWEQLHHLGNNFQALTQIPLPLSLLLWLPHKGENSDLCVHFEGQLSNNNKNIIYWSLYTQ